MEPTLLQGEQFAVDTTAFRYRLPSRGDLIVFRHNGLLIVKRVVAISGDQIEGKNFQIILNGKLFKEGYIQHRGENSVRAYSFLKAFPQITVSAEHVFVMGDNRDFSNDSRDPNFGTVAVNDVVGRAVRIVKSTQPKREGEVLR